MPAPPSQPPPPSSLTPEPESYTQMATAAVIGENDLDDIGAHCQHSYCHQLDFLPFRCESCKGTFCLDHRTEYSHDCPKAGEWAAARRAAQQLNSKNSANGSSASGAGGKPTLLTSTQCSSPTCKTYVNTHTSVGVHCQTCNRTYCLKHRLKEDHECSKLIPLGARPASASAQSASSKAQAALTRLRAWGREKQASASSKMSMPTMTKLPSRTSTATSTSQHSTTRTNSIIALNALKRTAKGDTKIPPEKRIYLHVEAESPPPSTSSAPQPLPPPKRGEYFYSADWSIGRLLDAAAKSLQVENVNNRRDDEEDRLRVFHVEGGRMLGFSEKLGACGLKSGETVVLLRGVGDGSGSK